MRAKAFGIGILLLPFFLVSGCGRTMTDRVEGDDLRNLLSGTFPPEVIREAVLPEAEWHPYPRSGERDAWLALPEAVREDTIARAEKHLGSDWPTPKASVFLEYVRNGNRSNYQAISFGRRVRLADLVLAECMEGRGRFLDDIVDGIWTIAEETYWGVPAHVGVQKRGAGLPDVTEPTVDLFAAETGMLLAWTSYLVGEDLDRISPLVRERIRHEVDRRILAVCLEREDFWWMGFSGRTVNNWNPWIASNWLTAVLLLEEDGELRVQSISKILECLDNFLNHYPSDGGCDEGPGYWGRAGASLFDCLELLSSASGGKIDVFADPLIQEIGRYIGRAYIGHPYFINFADAAASLNPDASLVFRYGRSIGDADLAGFGAFLAKKQDLGSAAVGGSFGVLGRVLPTLFSLGDLLDAEAREPLARDFWLPDLEVMGARSFAGRHDGFYVAAKGGHNAESHNHNDVGNFIVYSDGLPVLIDVGVETYTAKTFSSRRYEIWTMQSAFHNLPTLNGVMQKEGGEFRAADVVYRADDTSASLSLDIAGAYPDEASLGSWKRTITLERGERVLIRDEYDLTEVKTNLELNLMSWRRPEVIEKGRIRLDPSSPTGPAKPLYLLYDGARFEVAVETIPLTDGRLRSSWGDTIYRIVLKAGETPLKDAFSVAIVEGK